MSNDKTTQHTPTPWFSTENSWGHTTIHAGDIEVASLDIEHEATEDTQAELEVRMATNAAFIVRACNSHEQLVAAVEDMMEWARAVSDEYIDGGDLRKEYRQSLAAARAALAAAGEA